MIKKRTLLGIVLASILLGVVPVFSMAAPDLSQLTQDGTNLLANPGFEGITCDADSDAGWCDGNWTRDTFNGSIWGEIYSPQGWVSFWSEGTNPADSGWPYGRPECHVIRNQHGYVGPPARIRSGKYSVKQFGFFRAIDSGLYQVVTSLSSGATVQASAYGHAWSCDNSKDAYSCGDQFQMLFRVGIDPNGGTDPWSPNIVWASGYSYDEFRKIGPVEAQVGEAGTITVFLRETAKWRYKHNDVYWDDASLVYTTPPQTPTNTPLPPPPTPTYGPSPTPRPTPTPRPDGAVVHIVESGDTLSGIALMYNVSLDQIRRLNASALGGSDIIIPGQELVISIPSETPTPTPLPAPPTAEPSSSGSPTTGGASICVLAYHDRNGNTFRDDEATEELLPNAEFSVANASGVVARYTSNGVSEPYCFPELATGAYRVIQTAPPGYMSSGPAEWQVAAAEGPSLDILFGNVRSEGPVSPGGTTEPTPMGEENDGSDGGSTFGRIFATVAKTSGILVLILAAGVAVLFFLNRRRMMM